MSTTTTAASKESPDEQRIPQHLVEAELVVQFHVATGTALKKFTVESIQNLNGEALAEIKSILQHGKSIRTWKTPKTWYPGSTPATLNTDIRNRILHHLAIGYEDPSLKIPTSSLECLLNAAIISINRYLILCRIAPVSYAARRPGRSLAPSSIAMLAYHYLPQLAALSISKFIATGINLEANSENEPQCFARLTDSDVFDLQRTANVKNQLVGELRRMRTLALNGLWSDTPLPPDDPRKTTRVSEPAPKSDKRPTKSPHQPLPDEYVSEMGNKSVWIIQNLGPNILRALQDLAPHWNACTNPSAQSRRARKVIASFVWKDAASQDITQLPFDIKLRTDEDDEESSGDSTWRPDKAVQLFSLARLLQGSHMFVVALSMGARTTELATLPRSCVRYVKDGAAYAHGRTYKLVNTVGGEERDWVIPDLATEAIEQQARLVALCEQLPSLTGGRLGKLSVPGMHLWARIGGRGHSDRTLPLESAGVTKLLRSYARMLGMDLNPGGQALRPHRLRKTLARLAALAITYAPKVLQDVFGHKSIEMTLYYILTNQDLAAEIDTIAKELRVMRAEKVITDVAEAWQATTMTGPKFAGYGGAAAFTIDQSIQMHRQRVHRCGEDWGAADVRELAEILTMQGKTWALVRPGVLCTKSIGQAGPCNKRKGYPEPARCSTHCDYRLEESWHREDVDACIAESLKLYLSEHSKGEDLVAAHWAGQVRTHIDRFPDLRTKWMNDPVVAEIVQGTAI